MLIFANKTYFAQINIKIKSYLYYTRDIALKRVAEPASVAWRLCNAAGKCRTAREVWGSNTRKQCSDGN